MKCVTFTACALAVIGCSSDKPKPPPAPIDGVVLVQPGAKPRRVLRYQLATPAVTPLELAMDVDYQTADTAAVIPTMTMAVELATEPAQTGDATVRMTITSGGARARSNDQAKAAVIQLMDRQASQLAGLVITYTLSPAGQVTGSKVEAVGRDLSGPLQDQLATLLQLTEKLAMPLPDQPVGVGAVWKHRRTVHQNQLTLLSVTDIEITAIDGDRISFKSTTELTGADQTIAQGSATAQVTAIRGVGSQHGSLDLGRAIALGEIKATLAFEMIFDGARRPTKLDVVTRIAEPAPPAPIPTEPPDAATP